MNNTGDIHGYSQKDIERYHRNLMTMQERHAMEKSALEDPMLADALEGYALINREQADAELKNLHHQLSARIKKNDNKSTGAVSWSWMRVAALILLVAGASVAVFYIMQPGNRDLAVQESTQHKKTPAPSSVQDTTTVQDLSSPLVTQGENMETKQADTRPSIKKSATPPSKEVKTSREVIAEDEGKTKQSFPIENVGAAALRDDAVAAKSTAANRYVFRGRVFDNHNQPLPFANITNTADMVGTYADAKGYFTLTSADSVLKASVRFVGYETDTLQILAATSNRLVLEEDKSFTGRGIISHAAPATALSRNKNIVVEESEPEDGWQNYDLYIANNIRIPDEVAKATKGQVELSFEVNQQGQPVNIQVEKSLCPTCDQEAIRLLEDGPKWKRTKNKKVHIRVAYQQ